MIFNDEPRFYKDKHGIAIGAETVLLGRVIKS
jgi:hypothetical protein